jgi:hypothetical protein
VKKTTKKFFDLDLCYYKEIPLPVISQLREEFVENSLSFELELVN